MQNKRYTVGELINDLSKYDKNTPISIYAVYDSFMLAGGNVFQIKNYKKTKHQDKHIRLFANTEQKTDDEILLEKTRIEKINIIKNDVLKLESEIDNLYDKIDTPFILHKNNIYFNGLTNLPLNKLDCEIYEKILLKQEQLELKEQELKKINK